MTKEIRLSRGVSALVDDEDFEFLSQWKWQAQVSRGSHYAVRKAIVHGHGQVTIFMHRQLMGAPSAHQVDHANGDKLDNRKANLRLCTQSLNGHNFSRHPWRKKSPYRGVSMSSPNCWCAQACVDRKQYYFGSRSTPEEAARLYDQEIKKLRGEFAVLNFPDG